LACKGKCLRSKQAARTHEHRRGQTGWLAAADQIGEIARASRKVSPTTLFLSGDSVDPRVLILRPISELRPSLSGQGLDLVYVVDEDWDLWLLDAAAALETPDDFLGWIERRPLAALLSDVNKPKPQEP
jgi:hypothetical protein